MHKTTFTHIFATIAFLLFSQAIWASDKATLKVVVTIKPLHSLVATLMHGVKEPQLLLTTTQSAHHISLRPSDHRLLADADIVFWAGESLESFIPRFEQKYRHQTQFISLMKAKGVTLLPLRHRHHTNHGEHVEKNINDPHFWLSTSNAKQIVIAITQTLISADSNNKILYEQNQTQTLERINTLEQKLKQQFNSSRNTSFITYHDAYQYFENEFQLQRAASVSLNDETTPSIKQIRAIKKLMTQQQISCLFFDAPTRPSIIDTLLNGSNAQAVELDAIGVKLKASPDLWFSLLSNIGKQMATCLQHNSRP